MSSRHYYVTFLRHGESVGNQENRFQGQADFPLTEKGRAQARALAAQWQTEKVTFNQCFASPLLRAKETAEIVSAALNVPLVVDPLWMEMDNGRLAGLRDDEIAWNEPKFITPYTRFGETGESRLEVYLRAGRAIQSILDRPPGRYLVVSHGGILNMAMYSIMSIAPQAHHNGPRFWFRNTTYADFAYDPEWHNWRLLRFDRSHWDSDNR
ncbi:MAG: histidine phosphatase family protein [Anaerolineaceae bacterium]|nr:MAG: histidine phosphatase family protein [Anaerolineaceae bacterium]